MNLAESIDVLENYDDASILSELQRIAKVNGRNTVTKKEIEEQGRVSFTLIYRRFGSLRLALEKANLEYSRLTKPSKEELLRLIVELWTKTLEIEGRRPTRSDIKKYEIGVSGDTIIRNFGTWNKALYAAAGSVNEIDIDYKNLEEPKNFEAKRRSLSVRKRFLVFRRDLYKCKLCQASGMKIEVDHIIPWSRGGTDDLSNLQTLCFECNRGKRNTLEQPHQ